LSLLETHEAYELIFATDAQAPVVFTCEHASNRLPAPWSWTEADQRLIEMHWAFDLGIAALTRELAVSMGAGAALSRFTRLLVDPNRPLESDTLFREVADGLPVQLNQGLTEQDRMHRIEGYYRPFHEAAARLVAQSPGAMVVGMHSFTPLYEGEPREVEIGVLYDDDDAMGEAWAEILAQSPYEVRRNQPYTGKKGMMYSPQHHATSQGRVAVEMEIRQDLASDPVHRAAIRKWLARCVEETASLR